MPLIWGEQIMKLISLKCRECGADLQVDPGRKQVFCSYCGAKLLLDDESINITNRIIDEARLKEAEVRLRELEYQHERELREEALVQEQKRSRRLSLVVYLAAVVITYSLPGLRSFFPVVLVLGGIALAATQSGDRRDMRRSARHSCSPKSRIAALLICFLFGIFGGHYFYVGRAGMGFLYLITLGFFGIGWMIDLIRIACGIFTDRNGLYLR